MNKIYSEPIDKVKMLVEAVEKQKELLKRNLKLLVRMLTRDSKN